MWHSSASTQQTVDFLPGTSSTAEESATGATTIRLRATDGPDYQTPPLGLRHLRCVARVGLHQGAKIMRAAVGQFVIDVQGLTQTVQPLIGPPDAQQ